MALSIATIPQILFSADFPEVSIEATPAQSEVVVEIKVGTKTILRTSYTPVDGQVIIRGINDMVNEEMTAQGVQIATISIDATYNSQTDSASTTAIFSRYHINGVTASDFVTSHFLRRGEVSSTTRNATETLRYYRSSAGSEAMEVIATDKHGETDRVEITTSRTAGIVEIDASYSAILALFSDFDSIASYRIAIEDKSAFYYVIDMPMYEFSFRNMFGYMEVCRISGVFRKNFSTEKSFAVSAGRRMEYDVTHEMTMTIESSAMNSLEIDIFMDMVTSDDVIYIGEPALIVDYECNPTNQNGTTNKVSVEFEFTNSRLAAFIGESGHVFTSEFTKQYY